MRAKVLVVGTVRNCSKTLSRTVQNLEREIGLLGFQSVFFLVESDSNDTTLQKLESLRQSKDNFSFLSLGSLTGLIPERIQRIAHCRNAYLEHHESLIEAGESFSQVIVADFDGVNNKLRIPHSILALLGEDCVITANQFGRYYDILALRADDWVTEDYRVSDVNFAEGFLGRLMGLKVSVSDKQIKIRSSGDPINVTSAFGGLAIYQSKHLASLRYNPKELPGSVIECEHVSLHEEIRKKSTRILIAPQVQNSGAWQHTLASMPFLRWVLQAASLILSPERSRRQARTSPRTESGD